MRHEREIQNWMVQLASNHHRLGESGFFSVLRYDKDPLSQEMESWVKRFGLDGILAPTRHRSVHEACRVLQSLAEPSFSSAGTDISKTPGQIVKPDLVLVDEISGAFVIVEIKRSRKAAREFGTELLAYANCLREQHKGCQVFLVLVSTSWASLEQLAFAELVQGDYPALALEYREEDHSEKTPTLWVRSDLLPVANIKPFPAHALQVDTKVFWLPAGWRQLPSAAWWMNRIEHAVVTLTREAERGRASGFVIVWYLPYEFPDPGSTRPEVGVFVSMAVRNPCRAQFSNFKDEQEVIFCDESGNVHVPTDNTAVRLLVDFELGENVLSYSSESDGNWDRLRARLEQENASILRFDAFGELGDQVSSWRTKKRHALRPLVSDITAFPTWHPLTWLSALELLIDSSEKEDRDDFVWHAFHCGKDLSKVGAPHMARRNYRHFGHAADQARFALTWCNFFATKQDAPMLLTQIESSRLCFRQSDLDAAVRFASAVIAKENALASLCFALGVHIGSGYNNVDYIVSERSKLRMDGIRLPEKLNAKVDELEEWLQ